MKISETVQGFFQAEGRSNVLATTDKSGKVNVAVFGSFAMVDDETVIVMVGDNRTYANLQENPSASALVTLHGKTGMQQEGCRLYLKVRSIEDEGKMFDAIKTVIEGRVPADVESYSIAGRSITKMSSAELLKWYHFYKDQVKQEEAAERIASGENLGGKILTRFRNPR